MTTPRRSVLILLAFVASIALACSQQAESFDDLPSLAEAVSDAGVTCDRFEEGSEAELLSDSGVCDRSDVRLYLFDNNQDLADWQKVGARLGPTAIGPNWAATGDLDALRRLSDDLGAELSDR